MSQIPQQVEWVSLGRMQYDEALRVQESQRDRLLSGLAENQTVYAVEHPPTITIGRSGSFTHIVAGQATLEQIGMEVYEVDRGGDVTYHGPGQLVLYPVFHLGPWGNDVGRYVRSLEECVMTALRYADLAADRLEGYPGVWIGENKVCAIGVRMKRRPDGEYVTSHGLALNVSTELTHFQTIVPCGIADKGVTSIAQELSAAASLDEWEGRLRRSFSEVFSCDIAAVDP